MENFNPEELVNMMAFYHTMHENGHSAMSTTASAQPAQPPVIQPPLAPVLGHFNVSEGVTGGPRPAESQPYQTLPWCHISRSVGGQPQHDSRQPELHAVSDGNTPTRRYTVPRHVHIEDCLIPDADTPTVRALVLVYPPHDTEQHDSNHYVFRLLASDFAEVLEVADLAFRLYLPLNTLVNDFLHNIKIAMELSPSGYVFSVTRRASSSTAITALQLLSLVSKGCLHRNQV
ncbi:hypothetical protein C8F01DRAFT_1094916 [Mycena amicta]|nr:hypothetical protein C8F01DRAFT_1094916 [Mycena amicta]